MISFYRHIVASKIIKKYLTAKYYKKKKPATFQKNRRPYINSLQSKNQAYH